METIITRLSLLVLTRHIIIPKEMSIDMEIYLHLKDLLLISPERTIKLKSNPKILPSKLFSH